MSNAPSVRLVQAAQRLRRTKRFSSKTTGSSAATSPYVTDPLIKTFYDAVGHAWAYPNHAFYTEIREVIVKGVEAAIKQEKGVQAALDDAARGTQEFLDRR